MLVLDASAAVGLLLGDQDARDAVLGHDLIAPQLLDVEVSHALRKLVFCGELGAEEAGVRLRLLLRAPVDRVDVTGLVLAAWGMRDRVTSYDAVYVALAARASCALLTADGRLARAGLDVPVVVVGQGGR